MPSMKSPLQSLIPRSQSRKRVRPPIQLKGFSRCKDRSYPPHTMSCLYAYSRERGSLSRGSSNKSITWEKRRESCSKKRTGRRRLKTSSHSRIHSMHHTKPKRFYRLASKSTMYISSKTWMPVKDYTEWWLRPIIPSWIPTSTRIRWLMPHLPKCSKKKFLEYQLIPTFLPQSIVKISLAIYSLRTVLKFFKIR